MFKVWITCMSISQMTVSYGKYNIFKIKKTLISFKDFCYSSSLGCIVTMSIWYIRKAKCTVQFYNNDGSLSKSKYLISCEIITLTNYYFLSPDNNGDILLVRNHITIEKSSDTVKHAPSPTHLMNKSARSIVTCQGFKI